MLVFTGALCLSVKTLLLHNENSGRGDICALLILAERSGIVGLAYLDGVTE
jgi:hypothetical protein